MSGELLIDTHIALWLSSGDPRLASETRELIDSCWKAHGTIFLSAVSVWEIALLTDAGRLSLEQPVDDWVDRFLGWPGIAAAPLSHRAAALAYRLHHLANRDPADRLLIATAIELGCPFVTYDQRIIEFGTRYGGQYGFAVAGG